MLQRRVRRVHLAFHAPHLYVWPLRPLDPCLSCFAFLRDPRAHPSHGKGDLGATFPSLPTRVDVTSTTWLGRTWPHPLPPTPLELNFRAVSWWSSLCTSHDRESKLRSLRSSAIPVGPVRHVRRAARSA